MWAQSDFLKKVSSTQFYSGPHPKMHTDTRDIVASILSDKVVFKRPDGLFLLESIAHKQLVNSLTFLVPNQHIIACLICCFFLYSVQTQMFNIAYSMLVSYHLNTTQYFLCCFFKKSKTKHLNSVVCVCTSECVVDVSSAESYSHLRGVSFKGFIKGNVFIWSLPTRSLP